MRIKIVTSKRGARGREGGKEGGREGRREGEREGFQEEGEREGGREGGNCEEVIYTEGLKSFYINSLILIIATTLKSILMPEAISLHM